MTRSEGVIWTGACEKDGERWRLTVAVWDDVIELSESLLIEAPGLDLIPGADQRVRLPKKHLPVILNALVEGQPATEPSQTPWQVPETDRYARDSEEQMAWQKRAKELGCGCHVSWDRECARIGISQEFILPPGLPYLQHVRPCACPCHDRE